MRIIIAIAAAASLASCRGEPTPRDYQNNPPRMTHPVTTSSQSPTVNGMPGPAPEPSTAVQGKTVVRPKTETTHDQAPTATTATTGTRLATHP
jgi:hypothetical protein